MNLKEFAKKADTHIFWRIKSTGIFDNMSDEKYLKMLYKKRMKKTLNLDNPQTFNEKLQWLKLNDRNPDYIKMVDKYEAKKYVSDRIGDEYIIKTLGVWDSFDDIDFNKLPDRFVLKCTHDSGGLVICKDKSKLDLEKAKTKINRSLKRNYFYSGREWAYKGVKPRIIAEEYMEDSKTSELRDYKFFAFNGKVHMMFVGSERQSGEEVKFDFYDTRFNKLPIKQGHPNSSKTIEKPILFDKMIDLSEKLSQNIPQVRVDFYEVDGKIYFGELTFSHFGGTVPFQPEEWDYKLGQLIDLSLVKK